MQDVNLSSAFPSQEAWSTVSRLVFKIVFCMEKRLTIQFPSQLRDESLLHVLKRLFKSEYQVARKTV